MRIAWTVSSSILLAAVLALTPNLAESRSKSQTEAQFQKWIKSDLWRAAKARGVSQSTYQRAFKGITLNWKLPDLRVPGSSKAAPKVQRQAEFRSPARYFNQGNINTLVKIGRGKLKTWNKTLRSIEKRYGVPATIIVAIWARESAYGSVALPHNAVRTLATQAFMGRRRDFFENEILSALVILEGGHVPPGGLNGSWAGALGQPQFMPSKFLEYAVDFDGDGRRDIWNSVPDTLASIANYLRGYGWKKGRDWGFEAKVPSSVSCTLEGPEQGAKISRWVKAGVQRIRGNPFPRHERGKNGYLMMPAGRNGPAFVATENFYILKYYNESDLYALFIGHLADRYKNNRPFVQKWGKVGGFNRRDVQRMQQALERKGHDVGGADGLVGFKTRTAVGRWQEKNGRAATCFPDAKLVKAIR